MFLKVLKVLLIHKIKEIFKFISSLYLNPAQTWCYQQETFMGVVRPLVSSSSKGNGPVRACNVATTKWSRGVDMHLRGAEEWMKNL